MNKKNYILGLDLGITSVGWSCVELDSENEPKRIIAANSFIFPKPENLMKKKKNKKTKKEEAVITKVVSGTMRYRRIKRGNRRVLRRRKARARKTKNLFVKFEFMTKEEIKNFFVSDFNNYDNPYQIKVKGLHNPLTKEELLIALVHYSKYRGFKSNRKNNEEASNEKAASEDQKLLFAIGGTEKVLLERNLMISEYIITDSKFKDKIKNTSGEFKIGITRKMIVDEATSLLDKQVENKVITEEFKKQYLDILTYQRSFSEGPESGPYAKMMKNMVGKCIFDQQIRAPKCMPSVELNTLLQKLTNIRYYDGNHARDTKKLNKEQISSLVDIAKDEGKKITYKIVRDVIGRDVNFIGLNLFREDNEKIQEEKRKHPEKELHEIMYAFKLKKTVFEMQNFIYIKKELKKQGLDVDDLNVLDEIALILTKYKSDDDIKKAISNSKILETNKPNELKSAILNIDDSNFKTYSKLSLDVVRNTNKVMLEEGLGFSDALKMCEYKLPENNNCYDEFPPIETLLDLNGEILTNQGVEFALSQTRAIINKLISKYGKPNAIHVEVARELSKTKAEREKIEEEQAKNSANKLRAKWEIKDKFSYVFRSINDIKHDDIIKYKLYKEQGGIDPYTLAFTNDEIASRINETTLFSKEYEIDHIIPYSISYDDSYTNKILVSKDMNQKKGNRIPHEILSNSVGYGKYINYINSRIYSSKKRELLFAEKITDDMISDYSARALNDTRYITKTICSLLKYAFPDVIVRSFNGQITAKLRGVWGLNNLTTSYESPNCELKEDKENEAELNELKNKFEEIENKEVIDQTEEQAVINKIVNLEKKRDKKNRDNHYHHAVDATVIACATDSIRRRIEIHEQKRKFKNNEIMRFRLTKVDPDTGEVSYVTSDKTFVDYQKYVELTKNLDPRRYPVPYDNFRAEIIARIYQRDQEELTNTLNTFSNYTARDVAESKPLLIAYKKNRKSNGTLHKDTILGVAPSLENEEGIVLTNRVSITSKSFNSKTLEDIYDADGTQKNVYETVKEWLGDSKDGFTAFKDRGGYPTQANGNVIKKVKIIKFDSINERILINPEKQQYVEIAKIVEIQVYKKENENRLYFVALDMYRHMNLDKNPTITLWSGTTINNRKVMKYAEIKNNGYVIYNKFFVGETVSIKMRPNITAICRLGGFTSGLIELYSVSGDGYDLIAQKLTNTTDGRVRPSVGKIEDIESVQVSILGD